MATISKRNNKYFVRVRVRGAPSLHRTFSDRRAAQAWGVQVEDEIRRGVYEFGTANIPTLAQGLEQYVKKITVNKRGAKKETYLVTSMVNLPMASKRLDQIQAAEFAKLRDRWLKDLAPATVQRRLSILTHLYTIAIREWGYSITNPLLQIAKPKISNQRTRTISWEELETILTRAPNDAIRNIAALAWHTGARLGELVSLTWENVNLQAHTIFFELTKNGDSREVPLPPAAVALLESLQPKTKPQPTAPVFLTSSMSMSKAWANAVKKARKAYEDTCAEQGFEPDSEWLIGARFHDLRHSAITRLASHGLSTLELQAISGHKSMQMLSRYSHIKARTLAQKLARLEAVA